MQVIFFNSLSDSSLSVYGKATDFCISVLYVQIYWICLLVLIVFFFLVETLGFSVYSIMSSANSDSFTFFPSSLDAFYFFILSDYCG